MANETPEIQQLTNLKDETSVVQSININFNNLKDYVGGLLSSSNLNDNVMNVPLDMNGQRIINLPPAFSDTDPLRVSDLRTRLLNLPNFLKGDKGDPGPTPEGFRSIVNYGGGSDKSNAVNTAAFQNAYNDAPAGSRIDVPAGAYDYNVPTGTKSVIWTADGATTLSNSPMTLPGIVEGLFDNRILYQKKGTATDTNGVVDLQNYGAPGGNPNNISNTFSAYYRVNEGQTNGAWCSSLVLDSHSSNGNYPVQNSVLAVIGRQNVFNGTSLFGMNVEASEYHNLSNPTTNLLGAEIAVLAMGQDANNVRTGLSLPFQKRFPNNPGGVEFAVGLHMNQGPETHVKIGFLVEGSYDYVMKLERGSTTSGIFHLANDAGLKAMVMNSNQRVLWLNALGQEIASLGVNAEGVQNITGSSITAGGPAPSTIVAYETVVYNGTAYKRPLYSF